jgi:hypothetical protein
MHQRCTHTAGRQGAKTCMKLSAVRAGWQRETVLVCKAVWDAANEVQDATFFDSHNKVCHCLTAAPGAALHSSAVAALYGLMHQCCCELPGSWGASTHDAGCNVCGGPAGGRYLGTQGSVGGCGFRICICSSMLYRFEAAARCMHVTCYQPTVTGKLPVMDVPAHPAVRTAVLNALQQNIYPHVQRVNIE